LISSGDKELVRDLSFKDDKHLLAAWDAYRVMLDEEEFVDSVQVLCDVKRKISSQSRIPSSNEGGMEGGFNLMGGLRQQ